MATQGTGEGSTLGAGAVRETHAFAETLRRRWFPWTMGGFALLICALVVIIVYELATNSTMVWQRWGLDFLTRRQWNPVRGEFGALPFIVGTIVTSMLALLMAVPIALGIAILLSEYMPKVLRDPLIFIVELLAAIPSVVYGLWGALVLAPWLLRNVIPRIAESPLSIIQVPVFTGGNLIATANWEWQHVFGEPGPVYNMFVASVILAIMILPIIASLSREVLLSVPTEQKEAALALGCTRWEATKKVVLPYGRPGIFSAAILGLARALGETMAVTMVIGNSLSLNANVFDSAYTMPAIIANEFREAATHLHVEALVAVGLVLFVVSFFMNSVGRLIVMRYRHKGASQS